MLNREDIEGKRVVLTSGTKSGYVEGIAYFVGDDEIHIQYGDQAFDYSKVQTEDITNGSYNLTILD
ncbi:hypothetical protein D3C81_496870 [compost metagenome]